MAKTIHGTGIFLTAAFSIGAIMGATMTMFDAVAQHTTKIGTFRTLGFTRLAILQTFLIESMALGAIAGLLGVAGASFLQSVTISTVNWDTGCEIAFGT